MALIETFTRGIHSRPFTKDLNAYNGNLGVEWDYGGKLTQAIYSLTYDQWPVKIADLSYWQGDVDFAKLATKVQVVILRAIYGNSYIDPRLYEYYRGAKDNGLEVMLYHYLKPNKDWRKHVASFIEIENDYPAIALWGDIEENGGLNKTLLESWLYKYFRDVDAQKDIPLGPYSSKGFLDANIGMTNWMKNLPLWVASWTTASQPAMPNEYVNINNPKTWKLWQWTSKGSGIEHGVSSLYIDLNRYNGSIEQFNAEYKTSIKALGSVEPPIPPDPEPEPEPEPDEFPKTIETTAWALNVRTRPIVLSTTRIGSVPQGTRFDALGTVDQNDDWLKVIAYLHKGYVKDV